MRSADIQALVSQTLMSQTKMSWAKPFNRKARRALASLLTAASVAIWPVASTASEGQPVEQGISGEVSAAGSAALKPYAAQIGRSRKLQIHDQPVEAPKFGFANGDGAALALADFKGRVLLVNFWATWCGPCVEEMPALNALQKKLGGADFEVIAVSLDRKPTRPRQWLKQHEIGDLAFYHNGDTFGVQKIVNSPGLPTTLLIDRSGREVGRLLGAAEWDSAAAIKAIELLMAEPKAGG